MQESVPSLMGSKHEDHEKIHKQGKIAEINHSDTFVSPVQRIVFVHLLGACPVMPKDMLPNREKLGGFQSLLGLARFT